MKRPLRIGLMILLWLGCSPFARAEPVPGAPAPAFAVTDTAGQPVSLTALKGRFVVLEWTNNGCPYVHKQYDSGTMQRLQRTLTDAGVVWITVISSAPGQQGYVTAPEADQIAARQGAYMTHIVLDPAGSLGRLYEARTTPQMVLIDPEGTLRYMGAIDNRPSARTSSLKGATNYLMQAWMAIQDGKPVSPASTKPYGCSVKYGR